MGAGAPLQFLLLGPVEVHHDGRRLELGPRKQRMLLVDLCLAAPRVVPTDRLLEDLWGDEASGKQNALWTYVSRLRGVLEPDRERQGPSDVLVTRDHGYALDVDPATVDVHRFEAEVAVASQLVREDPARASARLDEALALWRGAALEEFAYEDFAQPAVTRLEELRLRATAARVDADLGLGRAAELIAELESLRRAHPLDERFVAQLVVALYRTGRHPDALRVADRFRRRLREELGVDPSPELGRLEERVLLHDDRLRGPSRSARGVPDGTVNPYRGLRAFEEADAGLFFGRDRVVTDVLRRIDDGDRLVALVGPSGSGKSSVARAGVLASVRKRETDGERWLVAEMVPGAHPFVELEVALARATIDPPDDLGHLLAERDHGVLHAALRVLPDPGARMLLVIDQLEELYTLVDADVRRRFLSQLVPVVEDPHGRVVVIAALRSDHYHHTLDHPRFGRLLGDAVLNVVPLLPDELEEACQEPAARAGAVLEDGLLVQLVTDVIGRAGALPLFQYALTELYDRRSGDLLTLDAYRAMGGVEGAVVRRAEDLHGQLDEAQRSAAEQLFLRLVAIDDDETGWSRRRVPASEVLALDVDPVALQTVIESFVRHRLLTVDVDHGTATRTIEVAHEALLSHWPRLRSLVEGARADVLRHAALSRAVEEWESHRRDPGYLLHGARLDDHATWASSSRMQLTRVQQTFIDESLGARQRARSEREHRVASEERRARAARRRLRALSAVVAAVVTILGMGGYGLWRGWFDDLLPEAEATTRALTPQEELLIGRWAGHVYDDSGSSELTVDLGRDGTATVTVADGLCSDTMTGPWSVRDGRVPLLVAEVTCDDELVRLTANGDGIALEGVYRTEDDRTGRIRAQHRPATTQRALTERELELAGDWTGSLDSVRGDSPMWFELGEDGTWRGFGEGYYACMTRGHWELAESDLLVLSGRVTCGGYPVRHWVRVRSADAFGGWVGLGEWKAEGGITGLLDIRRES